MVNTNFKDPYLLSCDWGTTSFRLRLTERNTGKVLYAVTTANGIKTACFNQSKETFQTYLASKIAKIEASLSKDLASVPMVISGMISSNIGWKELPYGVLPFSLDNPQLPTELIPATEAFPHSILLISGICTSNDVMRGEETQLLGLAASHNLKDGLCIIPGTHSKHIFIENRRITQFKTYMTGELFELLSTQSILKDSLLSPEKHFYEESFSKGVKQALKSTILNALFSIRANNLLHSSNREENYDLLSGLLIGSELNALRQCSGETIYLVGENPLRHRYIAALEVLEIPVHHIKNTSILTADGHRFMLHHFS